MNHGLYFEALILSARKKSGTSPYWYAVLTQSDVAPAGISHLKVLSNGDIIFLDTAGIFYRLDTNGNVAAAKKNNAGYPLPISTNRQTFFDWSDIIRINCVTSNGVRDYVFNSDLSVASSTINSGSVSGQTFIGLDNSGNSYEAGRTTVSGTQRTYVAKRNDSGSLLWAKSFFVATPSALYACILEPVSGNVTFMDNAPSSGNNKYITTIDTNGSVIYTKNMNISNAIAPAIFNNPYIPSNPYIVYTQVSGSSYLTNVFWGSNKINRAFAAYPNPMLFLCGDSLGNFYLYSGDTGGQLQKRNSAGAVVWTRTLNKTPTAGYCTTTILYLSFASAILKYPADGSITGTFNGLTIGSGTLTLTVGTIAPLTYNPTVVSFTPSNVTTDTPAQPAALTVSDVITAVG